MGAIRVGACGFCMRQYQYYQTFPVIELQKPFYRPPKVSTAQRWRDEAPSGFEFTLKAFQAVTHLPNSPTYRRSGLSDAQRKQAGVFRDTKVVRQAWRDTLEIARALDATFVLFQCPAKFKPTDENIENLRRFFEWAERDGMRMGWEPRGEEWTDSLVRDLCRELDLVHVVDPFQRKAVRGVPRYFRLHGITGTYHEFTDAELRRLLGWCTAQKTYCMFNNVPMRDDAQRFQRLVDRRGGANKKRSRSRAGAGAAR